MLIHQTKKAYASLASRLRSTAYLRHHALRTDFPAPDYDRLWRGLEQRCTGIATEHYTVDPRRFKRWVRDARYPFGSYFVNRDEKYLEHHVSEDLLDMPGAGLLIDVASCRSWFPAIMRRRGYRVIAQDLDFPPGLRGDRLGGNACALDVPDASVDGMTLHCSFEHFEGSADTAFVVESSRVLKRGGCVVILPLYLHQEYINMTDPLYSPAPVEFDPGATVVGVFGLANGYGRHYSVDAFRSRVVEPALAHGLAVRVLNVRGGSEISPKIYLRFALVLTKQ